MVLCTRALDSPLPRTIAHSLTRSLTPLLHSSLCFTRSPGHALLARSARSVGAINLDEKLIKDSRLVRKDEKIVELSNGCMCCTRRDDLLVEVREVAALKDEKDDTKRRFDVLIIESTGVSDPATVSEAFEHDDEMLQLARLDTMVTVVDTASFAENFASVATMGDGVSDAHSSHETHDHADDEAKEACEVRACVETPSDYT